jgi:DNA-binding NtrC family response regulator
MAALSTKGRVLIVDDDRDMCLALQDALTEFDFDAVWRTSGDAAFTLLAAEEFDAVVCDLQMEGTGGLDLCKQLTGSLADVPVVIMTAFASTETAIGAIRAGAYDFLTKPFELHEIAMTLERAVAHRKLRDEVKRLRVIHGSSKPSEMIGSSRAMEKVHDLIARIADSDASVLVTGESGTGKELVAKGIHASSRRAGRPFVAVNCAAMPESLLESELFGHVRGAFTDAHQARRGLFLEASGGTLFLDEIGEMSIGMQAKLLRVLQERVVRPVGGEKEIPFDTRIVTATNRDLDTEVAEHRFRLDLFYRIHVVRIDVPPLRARGNDVLALAQAFVERFATIGDGAIKGFTSRAAERLLAYSWPGNVRELQNCIERAVALARYELVDVDDLPEKLRTYHPSRIVIGGDDPSDFVTLREIERRYILRILEGVNGNKTHAASVLGVDRRTLYRKLERYGVLPPGSADAELGPATLARPAAE